MVVRRLLQFAVLAAALHARPIAADAFISTNLNSICAEPTALTSSPKELKAIALYCRILSNLFAQQEPTADQLNGYRDLPPPTRTERWWRNASDNIAKIVERAARRKNITFINEFGMNRRLNGRGPIELDSTNGGARNDDGRVITINGTSFAKGLGISPISSVTVRLPSRKFKQFHAIVGVADEVGPFGHMTFQVFGDGKLLFDSGIMTGADGAKEINVDVHAVKFLQLRVSRSTFEKLNTGVWAEAQLLTSTMPTPTASATASPSSTPTPPPTATATPTPTTIVATRTPTARPSATATRDITGLNTAVPTGSPEATPTGASTATPQPTLTPSAVPSATPTRTPTRTATGTPAQTPTATPTRTPTRTATGTPVQTPTATPTPQGTPHDDGLCASAIPGNAIYVSPSDNLQAKVDQAPSGATLVLLPGTYTQTFSIANKHDLKIRSESRNEVYIDEIAGRGGELNTGGTGQTPNGPVGYGGDVIFQIGYDKGITIRIVNSDRISICGLVIEGGTPGGYDGAIDITDVNLLLLEDIVIQKVGGHGLTGGGSHNTSESDLPLRPYGFKFTRVVTQDNASEGMGMSFVRDVELTDVGTFRNNMGWPQDLWHGDDRYICGDNPTRYCQYVQWSGGNKWVAVDNFNALRYYGSQNNGPGLWGDWLNTNWFIKDSRFTNAQYIIGRVIPGNDPRAHGYVYDAVGLMFEISDGLLLVENSLFEGNDCGFDNAESHNVMVNRSHFDDTFCNRNLDRNGGLHYATYMGNYFYGNNGFAWWDGIMTPQEQADHHIQMIDNHFNVPYPISWMPE